MTVAGVKGQSNREIAGSPESYLGSARELISGVEHCFGLGAIPATNPDANFANTGECYHGRHTGGR